MPDQGFQEIGPRNRRGENRHAEKQERGKKDHRKGNRPHSLKNAAELPSTTVWVSNSGRYAPPWNGNTRCFAIEETCSFFADGLKASIGKNVLTKKGWKTCGEFSKKSPTVIRSIQGVARIPAAYGKTKTATFSDGAVTFTDKKGNSVTVPVDWKYLME